VGDVIRHLAVVSVCQQQLSERLVVGQTQVAEDLVCLRADYTRTLLADVRPLAQPTALPRMTEQDDPEAFLHTFEVVARRGGWEKSEWVQKLAPLLTGEPQQVYFSLPPPHLDDYDFLKKEILAQVGLSPVCAAQKANDWVYDAQVPIRMQAAQLTRLVKLWLLSDDVTLTEVIEKVPVDRLLCALPCPHRCTAGLQSPQTLAELVEAVELSEAAVARESGERAASFPRRVTGERREMISTHKLVSATVDCPRLGWRRLRPR